MTSENAQTLAQPSAASQTSNPASDKNQHRTVKASVFTSSKTRVMLLLSLMIIAVVSAIISYGHLKMNQTDFELNAAGYNYQIKKCWNTKPPSYWLTRSQVGDQSTTVQIDTCTVVASSAIEIQNSNIDLDKLLSRNVLVQGEVIRTPFKNYVKLSNVSIPTNQRPQSKNGQSLDEPKEYFVIRYASESGEQIVYKQPKYNEHKLLVWQDYLFFEPKHGYDSKEKLAKLNLKTGEVETVYQEQNTRRYLDSLQIIDDTLYFSVAGYLAGSDMFWMDSPTGDVQKINYSADLGISDIENRGGRYWLAGGEGDACWSVTNHGLFDPATKTAKHVLTSFAGCFEGEELIDFDSQERMIVAYHRDLDASSSAQTQVYTYIKTTPIDNPSSPEYLLSEQEMPTNVYDLDYASESGQLALVGKSVHLFDIASRKLEKIIDLPSEMVNAHISKWTNEKLCISSGNDNTVSYEEKTILLNTNDYSSAYGDPYCKREVYNAHDSRIVFEERGNKFLNDLINSLNLPATYTVGIETE